MPIIKTTSQISSLESQFGDKLAAWIEPDGSNYKIVFNMNETVNVDVVTGISHPYPLQLNEWPDASIVIQYYEISGGGHVLHSFLSEDGGDTWTAV